MRLYPNHWNGISGFLDDTRSLEEKVQEELREEIGITAEHIISITKGRILEQDAPNYKKTWIVHPVLVEVDTDQITLDWEAQRFAWVTIADALQKDLLPGFDEVLQVLFPNEGNAIPLGTYRHFKGDLIEVLHVAYDSEEPEKQWVVYTHNDKVWVRPLAMFVEHIDRGDYHGPRFVKV